jgi:two-component system, OmpR family, response regulator NblR
MSLRPPIMESTAGRLSAAVLMVEPDPVLAQNLSLTLQQSGYDAILAADPDQGWQHILRQPPALIVIDHTLTGDAGLKFCTRVRQQGLRMPVLLMMARETIEDRVACLEAGADDYFLKPYRSDEFIKLMQFYLKSDMPSHEQLRFGDLVLDLGTRQALRNGRAIDLTMKEFELLKYLMEHPREVLAREQILENVWGYDFGGESNVIEVYIRYLRLKVEDEGEKRLIQTVRGVGYVLREA